MVELEALMDLIPEPTAPVNRLAAVARTGGVATLDHKVTDDAMENGPVVVLRAAHRTWHASSRINHPIAGQDGSLTTQSRPCTQSTQVWWCGGVVVWWCGGVVVWWCGVGKPRTPSTAC